MGVTASTEAAPAQATSPEAKQTQAAASDSVTTRSATEMMESMDSGCRTQNQSNRERKSKTAHQ
jgi:hypothetical protein